MSNVPPPPPPSSVKGIITWCQNNAISLKEMAEANYLLIQPRIIELGLSSIFVTFMENKETNHTQGNN